MKRACTTRSSHRAKTRAVSGGKVSFFPIVGVGASAGGLEALTALLKELPTDTGMTFLLAQHLDPKHESKLTDARESDRHEGHRGAGGDDDVCQLRVRHPTQ